MLEDILEFLRERDSASLDEIAQRFSSENWAAAKIEMLLIHMLDRGLIAEPRVFNVFEITDGGRDFYCCWRQEQVRLKQRSFPFSEVKQ